MPSYTLICPPLDTSPHIARDFVATVLRAQQLDGNLIDDAMLCTSELVTNACVHAKGGDGTVLWLAVEEGRLRVVVYDGDENPPVMRELTAETWERGGGRGLYLVDSLTEGRWGHGPDIPYGGQTHPEGKGVWFDLPVRRQAEP
ncbi:ATP-binding protein [Streptomyces sp. NL15-2K]|uniref:ATP-binding protein n=1 Tax=Streptomyces sp. NL15-2K TaxID=376149 RepID=UPI000F571C72|nr:MULTISPECIES: ATP-binding protein [Actinomycetes]WKX10832.1 ATP-binding protein [Kutzneria buriramensis]GCB47609.1 serine phosphatase rsbU [Streptomyces sp. NL15-2K]